jgi:hypothetical protein
MLDLYPNAQRVAASLSGVDVTGTPGIALEVKARRDLDLPAWMRQAGGRTIEGDIPVVISRPDGYGPERIAIWPTILPLWAFLELLQRGGFGENGGGRMRP